MIGYGQQFVVRGNNFVNVISEDGVIVFVNMFVLVIMGQFEGVFFEYQWCVVGEFVVEDKISYVKVFVFWGWVVGFGVYLVDIYSVV